MKELLEKISSYNVFNNFIPGVLFVIIAKYITRYDFIQGDILYGLFLYYFVGVVISRFGSVVIESILKKWRFIQSADYKDFIQVQKKDSKIDVLVEARNMFRTFCSMGFLLLILKLYEYISVKLCFCDTATSILMIVSIFILFLFSYKKQTDYIRERVENQKNEIEDACS